MSFPNRQTSNIPESGLVKELNKLGRQRNSSATPNLANATIVKSPESNLPSVPTSPRVVSDRFPTQHVVATSVASMPVDLPQKAMAELTRDNSNQYSGLASPAASDGAVPQPINPVIDITNMFRREILEFQELIQKRHGASVQEKQELTSFFQNIVHKFRSILQPYQTIFNSQTQLAAAEAFLKRQLNTALTDLKNTTHDKQKCLQRMQEIQDNLKKENEDLSQKLKAQDEQLKGKRALWLDQNPGHGVRREAMTAMVGDPFKSPSLLRQQGDWAAPQTTRYDSPSLSRGSGFASHASFNMTNRSAQDDSEFLQSVNALSFAGSETPTNSSSRRRGGLPSGLPSLRPPPGPTNHEVLSSLASLPQNTEPGSPERFRSHAVLRSQPSIVAAGPSKWELAPQYENDFKEIFTMAEKWCLAYASLPNLESELRIQGEMPVLWDFMMNCTYPHSRPDSNVHVSTLLQDSKARFAFCERMMITYFTTKILVLEEFDAFSPDAAADLAACKEALNQRGLASEIRRNVVLRYSKLLEGISQHPSFPAYQNTRVTHHVNALRNIIGPLLNTHAVRNTAGVDLGHIVKKVWETTVAVHTSYMTFQIYFPETNSKFIAATMFAKDQPADDQTALQFNQLRLKLVITPVVTLRDDSTTSIRTQNLHKATVLTMA